jgi:chromosomal replication initiation ATPase DnaA
VSETWNIDRIHIVSPRRTHDVLVPRQVAYALACRLTLASLPQIGRAIGNRDHSTIHHGRNKMRPKVAAVEARIKPVATALEWAQEMRKEMDPTYAAQFPIHPPQSPGPNQG